MTIEEARAATSYIGLPPDAPADFDMKELAQRAAADALCDVEMNCVSWQTLPTDLARYALDVMIGDLLVLGHKHTTVEDLAKRLGILDEMGNWT